MATNTAITGNSGTAGTWSLLRVPIASDDVVVPSGVTLTLTADLVCNSLTVTDGTVTQTTGSVTVTVGYGAGTVALNGVSGNALYSVTGSSTVQTLNCGPILETAATSRNCKVVVKLGATLTINNADLQTAGAGTGFGIQSLGGVLVYNGQARTTNQNATTTHAFMTLASGSTMTLNLQNKDAPPNLEFFEASAMTANVTTLTITPYAGALEFVSAASSSANQTERKVGL